MTKTNMVATLPIEVADINAAASATASGIVELATNAEAKTGTDTTRAVTAANVRGVLTGIKMISFPGRNGAGAISAVGAVAGDKVIDVVGIETAHLGKVNTLFEATITVNDQIQQTSASDLSVSKNYMALLLAVV